MTQKEKLQMAMDYATANRPKVGGFPFLAECLRKAGVKHNIWSLPAVMSMYLMADGEYVVYQGDPLMTGMTEVPTFDQQAIIKALQADQAGDSTFAEFLQALWRAGAWGYDIDFNRRMVAYMGSRGEMYTESYPEVDIPGLIFE